MPYFKVAALGYETFKDSDPVEAELYKADMRRIVGRQTRADEIENNNGESVPVAQV